MYWIPAFFIIIEIVFFNYIDFMTRHAYCKFLYEKFKDNELKKYIEKEFLYVEKINNFFGFFWLLEFLYFIVALFYPIWMISVGYFGMIIINNIFSKIMVKNEDEVETAIKYARLKNFTSSDIKFERMLKLNELKNQAKSSKEVKKYVKWKLYIFTIIKIVAFISIIVLHYNYKLL